MTEPASVVVAEDDPALLGLFAGWLRDASLPCRVTAVRSVASAVQRLSDPTDLLVTNRTLPDASGDTLLASLSSTPFDGGVLVLSGHDPDLVPVGDFARAAVPPDLVDAYLLKPVEREAFLAAVRSVLAGSVSRRS
jgi:CheY-like chemotaxis protein